MVEVTPPPIAVAWAGLPNYQTEMETRGPWYLMTSGEIAAIGLAIDWVV